MKKVTCLLVATVITILLTSCNDKSTGLLNTTPELSAVEDMLTLKTQDGDGPLVTKQIKPVLWDGHSELTSGVVYRFNNLEEMKAATANDPVASKLVQKATADGKIKTESAEPALASLPPGCSVDAWAFGNPFIVEGIGSTYNPAWSTDPLWVLHYILLKHRNETYDYFFDVYYDFQSHSNQLYETWQCNGTLNPVYVYAAITGSENSAIDDSSSATCMMD